MTSGELHPASDIMPTFRSLADALGTPDGATALIGSVIALALLTGVVLQSRDFHASFALSLVAGVLLSWHAYLQDAILILLAFAIVVEHGRDRAMRSTMALLVLPPVWFVLLVGRPWSAVVPLLLLGTVAVGYAKVRG